jgi:hypothetical protein
VGRTSRRFWMVTLVAGTFGCAGERAPWVLPDPDAATTWYGAGTTASIDGNVLDIQGTLDPDYLRRGGRIWARGGPYFYLFNVHVQQLFTDYPDLAAVRVRVSTPEGEELASAMLRRDALSEARWREALARASLAQQGGSENPRLIERLIQFGEDHTEFRYGEAGR